MAQTASRWDDAPTFTGGYSSPGWRRGRETVAARTPGFARTREVIEGKGHLVATSDPSAASSSFTLGMRVFHQKFGYGAVTAVEGNKLTVAFEKAGEKKVIDTFVEKA